MAWTNDWLYHWEVMSRRSECRRCGHLCTVNSTRYGQDYRPLCRECRREQRIAAGASKRPGGVSNGRKRWKSPEPRPCAHCGGSFLPGHHSQRYCTPECSYEHDRSIRQERARLRRPPERVGTLDECAACCRLYSVERGTQRYCSESCSSAAVAEQNYLKRVRRSERLAASSSEKFDRREIFERDEWRCGICQTVVERDARVPHLLAPTIDHIIPIARGGGHTRDNVQCAHFSCNSRKRDSVVA